MQGEGYGGLLVPTAVWLPKHISDVELIVSAVLLIIEAVVLYLVLREPVEREKHILAVKQHTRILGREAYVSSIEREMRNAKEQILLYWHSLHAPDVLSESGISEDYKLINEYLLKAHKRNLDVKLIVAKDVSRIAGAYALRKRGVGVPIYFQEMLLFSDLRFSLFDSQVTVFGTPGSVTNSDNPSRYGVDIRSRMLAVLMQKHFEHEERAGSTYEEYVAAEAHNALYNTNCPIAMVSEQLGIPIDEIARCQAAVPHAGLREDEA
jgi:hypothetical protein